MLDLITLLKNKYFVGNDNEMNEINADPIIIVVYGDMGLIGYLNPPIGGIVTSRRYVKGFTTKDEANDFVASKEIYFGSLDLRIERRY